MRVTVYEVGPRDGLQNEAVAVPSAEKIAFVNALSDAGLNWIETTSFVNPSAVPQMSDASEIMSGIDRKPGVRYPVLVPNERGMNRALEAGVDSVALFAAASEAFSHANIRTGIDGSFDRFAPVARLAKDHGVWLRGYVSTAFHCPYSGPVAADQAVIVAERLFELGCDEVAIADTIGAATPLDLHRLLPLATHRLPVDKLAMHFHDTTGLALPNVMLSLEAGITVFDGSAGGLGGCPFAPGAPGNLATEKLVRLLDGLGVETGVNADMVEEAGRNMRSLLAASSSPVDRQ
jgi:hydroxymethylglutaryl-CoA lyase